MDGRQALEELVKRNGRFVEKAKKDAALKKRLDEVYNGQKPFATILSCSDSRVVPEFIFDSGIGDLFIIRNAGNIIDDVTLGTIEYGVEHLHTPLLVVLAHEKCGAVTSTYTLCCKGEKHTHGNIDHIVQRIMPAAEAAPKEGKPECIECCAEGNMDCVIGAIRKGSPVVREMEEKGQLKVVGIKYCLKDGSVKILRQ
ncbi:MAG: carbonic anhydrase [Candidatus Bilamarchaeaceae archaeon]